MHRGVAGGLRVSGISSAGQGTGRAEGFGAAERNLDTTTSHRRGPHGEAHGAGRASRSRSGSPDSPAALSGRTPRPPGGRRGGRGGPAGSGGARAYRPTGVALERDRRPRPDRPGGAAPAPHG